MKKQTFTTVLIIKKKSIITLACFLLGLISISTSAQVISVAPGTEFTIGSGTLVSADSLDITPSANFILNGCSITKSNTAINSSSIPNINKVYQFSNTTNAFSGALKMFYNNADLNGITASSLKLLINNGSSWSLDINSTVNTTNKFVENNSVSGGFLKEISAGAFGSVANAPTNYRGAFAPAPAAQWTDNWTNWDPQNTYYPVHTDSVQGNITTNTTWTKDKVYLIKGLVYVDTLVTLTIEPGTVILGDHRTVISTLVVSRGGQLIANGTACNPIVFTSSRPAGQRLRGDWGGIALLGRATSNRGLNNPIEGIADAGDGKSLFGGTDDDDNSGSLRYVRIEFAGYTLLADQELNSLTMGGVGRGTTIDYVQCSFGNDDAFEWFGGTVNCSHLVAYKTTDDDLDVDQGYSGTVQFALAIKDPARSDISQSEGFETDNGNPSNFFTVTPRTSGKFYNVTVIGGFRCTGNNGPIVEPSSDRFKLGARFRRGSQLEVYNSILMNNYVGLEMTKEGGTGNVDGVFQNNIIAMDTTFAATLSRYVAFGATAKFLNDTATARYFNDVANRNSVIGTPCDMLVNAWDELNPDFRPNAAGAGAALAGADLTPSIDINGGGLLLANTQVDMIVNIFENAVGNSNGTITVTIPVPAAFPVTVPGLTLTSTPQSGTNGNFAGLGADYFNGDWMFSRVGANIIATSKVGVTLTQNGATALGFLVSRPATGTPSGTNSNLSVTVSGGSDVLSSNDSSLQGLSAN